MLSPVRTCSSNALRALGHVRRYSTPIEATLEAGVASSAPGARRPHLNIPVNPNHGLYAFFRKREKDEKVTHDPFEDEPRLQDVFGRSWAAAELRRKSFRDLHTLWYVLLRERNLIATQMENYRRATVPFGLLKNVEKRDLQCRKSMARIKYVINERRHAYEGAMKIHAEKVEQIAKENEAETRTEKVDTTVHQESEAQKGSPPLSEATQAAVDGLLQRSAT